MAVQETKIKADVLDDNLYIAVQEVKIKADASMNATLQCR
jgi:hypothetical protein